ncbi:MFS transporter [Variovorax sp. RT4R15]|uniref:MFS transporter n=1 Tax=Variovorax sp. RT4R15 TaxID=3443737 RepID=UPI003F47FAF4
MAVFVVSAGYGALLPVLPGWLTLMLPAATPMDIARHIGFASGVYAMGVLVGAPLWGFISDRVGRNLILITGFAGYLVSLMALLVPGWVGIEGLYVLRGSTGFFVAAIVPLVSVIVAERTVEVERARRFAWLGSMSLLGFLVGPAAIAAAGWLASSAGARELTPASIAQIVILLTAAFGGVTMIGLLRVLQALPVAARLPERPDAGRRNQSGLPLWGLGAGVMFVLAAFELGILLEGLRNPQVSPRNVALMFAECSLVMLAVNALLFFTPILNPKSAHRLAGIGLLVAMVGLAVLSNQPAHGWMYLGVSLTAAGTGLVLPVVSYLAAGVSRADLAVTMGGLAAGTSLGQTLGSAAGGWLFGASPQHGFGWLALPLASLFVLLLFHRASLKNIKNSDRDQAIG